MSMNESRIVLGERANVLHMEPNVIFKTNSQKPVTKKIVNRGRWSKEEDSDLRRLVEQHGENWSLVASFFVDRNDVQCQQRWCKVLNPKLIKGPWTQAVSANELCVIVVVCA